MSRTIYIQHTKSTRRGVAFEVGDRSHLSNNSTLAECAAAGARFKCVYYVCEDCPTEPPLADGSPPNIYDEQQHPPATNETEVFICPACVRRRREVVDAQKKAALKVKIAKQKAEALKAKRFEETAASLFPGAKNG